MKKKWLKALKASIAHWEDIVAYPHINKLGPQNCPLCIVKNEQALLATTYSYYCGECPVKYATGENFCEGTPYTTVLRTLNRTTCQAELDFLRALVPAHKRNMK